MVNSNTVQLGDICDEIYRYPSFYGMEHLAKGVPVIRGEHIDEWGNISQDWNDFWFISEEISNRFPRTILHEGDLVFTVRGTIGKVGLITKVHDGAQLSPNLIRFSPKREVVDSVFLWYFLQSIKETAAADIQNEVTIASVRASDLSELKIPLPPLTEQKRIASLLARADRVRRLRRTAHDLGESLLQSVFLEMFGNVKTNEKGWEIFPLEEIVQPGRIITYGIVQAGHHIEDGIPYIRTGDIKEGQIVVDGLLRTSKEIAAKYKRSEVKAGELVMSIRATVGTIAELPPQLDGANLTQGTARISPGSKVNKRFLLYAIRSQGTQKLIEDRTKGATFREITLEALREVPMIVPPLSLQEEFAGVVARVESLWARTRRLSLARRGGRSRGCLRVCWLNHFQISFQRRSHGYRYL